MDKNTFFFLVKTTNSQLPHKREEITGFIVMVEEEINGDRREGLCKENA